MNLQPSELSTLAQAMRGNDAEHVPTATIRGSRYRLLAFYDNANPAVLGLKVHANRPAGCRLTLMTSNRFGVPTPGHKPSSRHHLTIHDLVDMVANGPVGKPGYTSTAWPLFRSVWDYGIEPPTHQLADFVRQAANSRAIIDVFGGGVCFQSVYWSAYPKPAQAPEILARAVTAYLVARDKAATAARVAGVPLFPAAQLLQLAA